MFGQQIGLVTTERSLLWVILVWLHGFTSPPDHGQVPNFQRPFQD